MADYVTKSDLREAIDSGFDHIYKKLTKHLDKQFDKVKEVIADLNKKYNHLINTLNAFLKRLDNIEANDVTRDAQLARHEKWLEQIAAKTGVKLSY